MAEIKLRGVSKSWGDFIGVDNIDLDIRDKEFMVFLGPSGCGKTTTMRMIAGLEDPTGGDISIDGESMTDVDARDRDVAMVFQSYALYPNMSIYENIRFPLKMRGIPAGDHDRLVRQAADMVELGQYLDRKPRALSGGQRQRAALARAIVRQPQVFLMDEPLSNLDAKLRLTMRAQLKHIQRQLETTTVYVTHDQIEAMTLADRIAVMNKGKIQQLGTPDEVYNNPNHLFVAGFIGSPPMNLIPGALENGDFVGPDTRVKGAGQGSRANVVLGVRPEDMEIVPTQDGHLISKLYSLEPTGDVTLVTAWAGEQLVVAKGSRVFRQEVDTPIAFKFAPGRVFLFDGESGNRI
ncbi:ABC transporter ATP-binding protein [Aestuariivirga sp. YIM B02566]|uniref:ABC transporter ATP-binding protein n=1 Tax=Taklimakanibacter albus TaxID=2800327 RepID=A0ACC5RD38_9HYPH|nr:ABC transporter ATP-binding protein [Aestuariivirga sp. YIM B02566]MBK1870514.1 ABC transporter ATP-binding protein [Aestuariivirga sp. YIM B02566]